MRRLNLVYEVISPTLAQLLMLHQGELIALASDVKDLARKRTLNTRDDILEGSRTSPLLLCEEADNPAASMA